MPRFFVGAGLPRREHVVDMGRTDHDDAVGVADDPVAVDNVDVADQCLVADVTGLFFRRAAQGDHRREHGEAMRFECIDVAHAAVDHESDDAARLGRGRKDLAPVAALRFEANVHDEHRSGRRLGDGDVDREVVGRAAHDRERGPADARARPHGTDARRHRSPTALAKRGGAEGGKGRCEVVVSHESEVWRRARDLNPRGGLSPPTRLAGEHLRPLGQPSGAAKYTAHGNQGFRAVPTNI